MLSQLRSLNINVRVRLLTSFLSRFFGNMVYPFMSIYLTLYFSDQTAGTMLLIITSAAIVMGFLSGYLADIFGKKKIIIWAQLCQTSALAVMALFNSPIFIIPSVTFMMMLLQNTAIALLNPAAEAMIIDDSTPKNRSFIYAIDYWAMNLSIMFGSMIGGLFFNEYRFELFTLLSLSSLVVLYIMARYLTDDAPSLTGKNNVKQLLLMYGKVLQNRQFVIYCVAQLLVMSLDAQVINYVSVRLAKSFQAVFLGHEITGIQMAGLIRTENTLIVVLMTLVVPSLTKMLGEKRSFLLGLVMYIPAFFFIISSNNFYTLVSAVFVASIGEVFIIPLGKTMLAELSTQELRGTYMALNGFIYRGTALLGALGVMLASTFSPYHLACFWVGLASLGFGCYLYLLPKIKLN